MPLNEIDYVLSISPEVYHESGHLLHACVDLILVQV